MVYFNLLKMAGFNQQKAILAKILLSVNAFILLLRRYDILAVVAS
jgi:ABC-type sugar transport system ATPase subunit